MLLKEMRDNYPRPHAFLINALNKTKTGAGDRVLSLDMHTRLWRPPPSLLWTASHHSASPVANFLPKDSFSGVQLCPQVLGVKKEQSNYSISGPISSLLYVCTWTQKQASKVFQTETAKCVKNISTLLLYCVLFERRVFYRLFFFVFFYHSPHESQNPEVISEQGTQWTSK